MGMVTLRNFAHSPAPSISAASYSSLGMPFKPASKITEFAPNAPHRLRMMKAGRAKLGSVNQRGVGTPSKRYNGARMLLSKPESGEKIHRQSSADATAGKI